MPFVGNSNRDFLVAAAGGSKKPVKKPAAKPAAKKPAPASPAKPAKRGR